MRFLPSILVASLVLACGGEQDAGRQGSGSQGQGAQEPDPAISTKACEGKPIPTHECVGGVPARRCNVVSGEPRWQIDCVPPDPNAPADVRGVSPCEAESCGSEPAWDANDCVYGFAGKRPSCESVDRGACTWTRRCRPKPCSAEEGTCNVLHEDRLGAPCSAEVSCPSGSSCATISVDIGEGVGPVCVTDPPCSALTCAQGNTCMVLESYPSQIVCQKM